MRMKAKRIISLFLAVAIIATSIGYGPPAVGAQYMPYIELEEDASIATPSEAVRPDNKATSSEAVRPDNKATPSGAVRRDNKATPSGAVPSEEKEAPSEAEKKFVRVEPEEIPEYYNKTSQSGKYFWKFEDRYGNEQYRNYGFVQGEAEFPLWYESDSKGMVEVHSVSINLDEEFYDLAPYIYESIPPTDSNWSNLSFQVWNDTKTILKYGKKSHSFKNWDLSNYDIWMIEETETGETGYYFYGRIKNQSRNETGAEWYRADTDGNVLSKIRQFRMSLYSTFTQITVSYRNTYPNNPQPPDGKTYDEYFVDSKQNYNEQGAWESDQNNKVYTVKSNSYGGYTFLGWGDSTQYYGTSSHGNYIGFDAYSNPQKYEYYSYGGRFIRPGTSGTYNSFTDLSLSGLWIPNGYSYLIFVDKIDDVGSYGYSYKNGYQERVYALFQEDTIWMRHIVVRNAGEKLNLEYYSRNLSKDGYQFDGWIDDNGTKYGAADDFTFGPGENRLYPCWAPNSNTVTFKDWDGTVLSEQTVPSGSSAAAPEVLPREGYRFTGWDNAFDKITSSLVVTATYEKVFNITFHGNTGSIYGQPSYHAVLSGEKQLGTWSDWTSFESSVIKTGYTLTGWNTDPDGKGTAYTGYSIPSSDLELYAQWKQNLYTLFMYRNLDGTDTSYTTNTVGYGEPLGEVLYLAPQKGKKVVRWNTSANGAGEDIASATLMGEASIKAYAQWGYFDSKLLFDYEDFPSDGWTKELSFNSSLSGDKVGKLPQYPKTADVMKSFKKPGYYNVGWYEYDLTSVDSTAWWADKEEIPVFIKWVPKSVYVNAYLNRTPTDAMVFQNHGMDSYGQTMKNIPNATSYAPTGKVFAYWSTIRDGSGEHIDFTQPLSPYDDGNSNSIIIYAYAQYANQQSTITFKDADGTVLASPKVKYGDPIPYPAVIPPAGYQFKGWDKDLGAVSNVLADTVITAQYETEIYSLTLQSNGGTYKDSGDTVKIFDFPANMEADGSVNAAMNTAKGQLENQFHIFKGWYTLPVGGIKIDAIDRLAEDRTLYAQWDRAVSEVIYKDWDGTIIDCQEVAVGGNATPPVNPNRTGYTFTGWDKESTNIQADTTITAEYSKNSYKLTLDGNGGTLNGKDTREHQLAYGDSFDQILTEGGTEASQKYYTFAGWYTDKTGGSKYPGSGNTMPASNVTVYAHWTRTSNEVIYKDWDGTIIKRQDVAVGGNATPPSDPARPGYTFTGWDKPSTNIQADTTITAEYSKNSYKLTLDGNGGTLNGKDTREHQLAYGDSFDQILTEGGTEASQKYYTFAGWYTDKTGGSKYPGSGNTMPASNVTVYARWTRSSNEVVYKDWDGTIIDRQEVAIGGNATSPADPARPGYTFTGWDKPSTNIQADTTITAEYSKNSYKLTLDGNGGTLNGKDTREHQLAYGDSFDQILTEGGTEASQKYYTFAGWYTDKTGGSKYPGSGNTMPASNVTVYAHWTRTSNEVIYQDWDGTIIKRQEVAIGGNAAPPADPARPGYTFSGWDKPSTNIQTHTTITAQYSKNSYQLILDGNGGSLEGEDTREQTLFYGDSIDQILTDWAGKVRWKYYTFDGWYTEKAGGSKYPGSGNTMPASNVTVYAHWTRSSNEVIYKDWDGTIIKRQDVAIGRNAIPPTDPARPGYTFTGWDKESTNIQANTTITAQYSKNSYKLTLDGNGGSMEGSKGKEWTVTYKDSFDQILTDGKKEVSLPGYTFDGWYTSPTGGDKYTYSGNQMPASDITVYAHWKEKSYTVNFDPDHEKWKGGLIQRIYTFGTELGSLPAPEIYGWEFLGWWTGRNGTGERITENTKTGTQDLTYYGNWKILQCFIHFDKNLSAIEKNPEDKIVTYGEVVGDLPVINAEGYTFLGWHTDPTGGEKAIETTPAPLGETTYYAHWDIVQKPTEPKPTEPQPSKPESRGKEEIIAVPAPPSIDSKAKPNVPDTGGNFIVNPDNLYDVTYTKPDGTAARDEWVGDGMDWYHVDEDGKLSYDWYLEGEKTWYKLNREPGDKFGAALIGWNYESMDDKRYFFAPSTTEMLTGWQKIDNKWYYFTKQNEAQTYYGSNRSGWHYDPTKPGKPYGSMYRNEMTPDGYLVDENGVWVN